MVFFTIKIIILFNWRLFMPFRHSDSVVILTWYILLIITYVCVSTYYFIISFIIIVISTQRDRICVIALKKFNASGCHFFSRYYIA
jgi:hypothetical protein